MQAKASRYVITAPDLRAQIDKGLTTAQIAAHFGVQSPAITRACHRFGLALPPSGRVQGPTRADDERLLDWLAMARRGCTVREIAKAYGDATGATVQAAIKAVEVADLGESGEPARDVARAYPKRRARS